MTSENRLSVNNNIPAGAIDRYRVRAFVPARIMR